MVAMKRMLSLTLLGICLLGAVGDTVDCWVGRFSWQTCCDPIRFGPLGNGDCWDRARGITAERCCHAVVDTVEDHQPIQRGNLACWVDEFTFKLCCSTEDYGSRGNPTCWNDEFTFERCCHESYLEGVDLPAPEFQGNPDCWLGNLQYSSTAFSNCFDYPSNDRPTSRRQLHTDGLPGQDTGGPGDKLEPQEKLGGRTGRSLVAKGHLAAERRVV
ncbi:hypothetical protein FOZ63_024317 [Perkinsus olseni]|uniref:Folate receptor-like domain-containing protein n=1 Tax=Perkinsus olseni TaxID=32597 RepID=A0A7J6TYD1_PEROL|nr:hypothetical protein FOZ63_024317 [Perkinsus olseni]